MTVFVCGDPATAARWRCTFGNIVGAALDDFECSARLPFFD